MTALAYDHPHELSKGRSIQLKLDGTNRYVVCAGNGVRMGMICRDCDLLYNFWPQTYPGGFWPGYMLKDIAEVLATLNKPIEDEFNRWCEEEAAKKSANESSVAL